jgi:glycosyltransferase involved in cell wall biosynthesis
MTRSQEAIVSVIVPAFNAAQFIGRTLDNVLKQTHSRLEVLVVDDGSSDETADIVRAFADRDNRVRLFQQPNAGVSAARNHAMRHAKGDYIAPLDADDLWHPLKLAKQLEHFDRGSSRTGVVYCHFALIDEEDRVILPRRTYNAPSGQIYPQLTIGNVVGNASAPLIRRSLTEEAGGYDETFKDGCEDLDFYLRLAERCEYGLVPEFLVGYRRSSGSMSTNIPKMERSIEQLTKKMTARHPDLPTRLLRWRDGNMYRYLALYALMNSDYRRAFRLAAKSVLSDPLLLIVWPLARLHAKRAPAHASTSASGPLFLSVAPAVEKSEQFQPTALDRRRQALAERMRIESCAI